MTESIEPENWPERGRVGYCRGGERKGESIFLQLGTDDRDAGTAYWQAFFVEPNGSIDSDDEYFIDNRSGLMQAIISTLDVAWAPSGLDLLVEDSVFGLRRWMAANGATSYLDVEPPPGSRRAFRIVVDPARPWAWADQLET